MGFNKETAHCFHCDGSWNIFSYVKEAKHCDFKEALEYLANISGMQDELQESRRRFIDNLHKEEKDLKRDMKFAFIEHIKDKEYSIATELLVDYIEENNFIYTTKNDLKTEMWIYRDGIYTPNGKSEVKEIVREILGDWYNAFYCNQILNKIEADTFVDADKFFQQANINEIPVKNGILNILTRELKQFSPEKIFFNKLPVEYNPLADCQLIEKFLKDVLSNEDDINVFYEIGGFTLLKEYKFEKAFMFVGQGRNGKDKTLELIKRTIGVENCCSVPLSSLSFNNFIISEFFGKLANLSGEINNQDLKETGTFKQLTGRSIVSAQRKFLTPITFQNFAKFVFACNDLPMVYDMSKGFWDRWVLLEFPYSFVTREELGKAKDKTYLKLRDEGIIDRITTQQEISGLLNKFLDGLDRLLQLKTFSSTKGSEDIKNLWIRKANSFMAFCLDCIQDDYEGYISKKDLRKKYKEYCLKHKITGKNDFVIKRTLEEMFGAVEEKKNIAFCMEERVWIGIKWKETSRQAGHTGVLGL
jgi:putative DNA primase/helicase